MSDEIVTQPEQEIDFVEYLRLWASPDSNDQAVRALHKAADEIEHLRAEVSRLRQIIVDASPDDDYFLVRKEADAIWEIAHNWKMPNE